MEMFETLTKCPGCGHEAKRVYLSAAAFTKCGACLHIYRLTAETLENLARVALLNLPADRAAALLTEARVMLDVPELFAARVEPVGAMGEAARVEPMLAEALTPELRTLHAVCDRLRAAGLEVSIEYPGHIETPDHVPADVDGERGAWAIGTANETWGGNVLHVGGAEGPSFVTDVPSTSTDADAISAAILAALSEWCRTCGETLTDSDIPHDTCADCARTERAALRSRGER